jgi:signal transduction histidine kinase
VVDNLENRVREMNVLSRVSQGINITLKLDDILELIYAQATQIIPADDFQILLLDNQTGIYNRLFYIVENDRLTEFENKSVLGGQDLEQEIIRQRHPLITENYTREGQKLGIPTTRSGLYAWMGVPLNAGAEPIGALSLGSRNPSIVYTNHQLSSLQAIADQLAGAIVKARLLEESERRARQLDILNQMSSQLTATLELDPLLKNITDGAAEILNCEAGSLLMVDEQTGDLVFKVTVGPVAGNLLGKRLPAGSGVVGRAVKTRSPLIINDVQKTPFWSDKTDKETGFVTRSILVVPIQVQEKVIGVIEVINPRSGAQFSKEDQDLLTAFTAQAAVAIENARLYTMTDQALANRVEELSIMQRIDRELNTSLEAGRTLKITLDWAMNQSKAEAGFVGLVRDNGIEISSWQNYTDEIEPYKEALLPLDRLQLQTVINDGEARNQVFKRSTDAKLLAHAHSQIVVPIRRENETMGVMVLESTGKELGAEDETLNFLKRLSDHAAIALSNAQLYAAIQAANLAKSEFVSFVSHELKNPMTSIKGYTELLAAGAVGPVNENQANFLATIRSNVDRMATLVSDLADVSRIEAGRMRLEFKATGLKEVIDEVVRSLQKQIDEKQQTLVCDVSENMENLWVDRSRLVQIVTNLISNSNKYSPKNGEISVGAEVCANQWDPEGTPQVAHIWVKDTGIGMKPEDQVKVFQKFFRSEDPKTREAPGTGLGLNITKSLIELQGGKIWFESEFRKGTTFHFTMPIATS